MDANRRQSGIQQLLAAEQEAQQIVNAARAAKSARLRQAKEEAEREIAEYRAQMEADPQPHIFSFLFSPASKKRCCVL